MKPFARTIAPSLLLLACALVCHAQPPAPARGEWREFAPAGGGFSILFPGTPEAATLNEPVGDGQTVQSNVCLLNHPTLECSVSYGDYPARTESALVVALLDKVKKSAPANGDQLLGFTPTLVDGKPVKVFGTLTYNLDLR